MNARSYTVKLPPISKENPRTEITITAMEGDPIPGKQDPSGEKGRVEN